MRVNSHNSSSEMNKKMKWQGILNRKARSEKSGARLTFINQIAPTQLKLQGVSTLAESEAVLQKLIDEHHRHFAVAGGDGSFHHTINYLLNHCTGPINVFPIPLGSGNDWARSLGINTSLRELTRRLSNEPPQSINVFRVCSDHGQHWGINSVGCGFDTQVLEYIDSHPGQFLKYWRGLLKMLARRETIEVKIDDNPFTPSILTLIGVGQFAGQGFKLLPDARLTEGLAITHIEPLSNTALYRELPHLQSGRFVSNPKVTHWHQNDPISLEFSSPQRFQIDGELYPETLRLTVETVSNRVHVYG